jgi:hypothetical protein
MEKIFLGEELIIYRILFNPTNGKDDLLIDVNQHINDKQKNDCDAFPYCDEFPRLNEIIQMGISSCLKIAQENNVEYTKYKCESWINIVRGKSPVQFLISQKPFHNHVMFNKYNNKIIPSYTFVYYIQMPNNLNVGDAELVLKDNQGNEHSILPKENEFLIHESKIEHYPKDAKNSTVDRIVLAGNVGFE